MMERTAGWHYKMKPDQNHIEIADNIDLQVGRDRGMRVIDTSETAKAKVVLVRPPLMFASGSVGNYIVPSIGLAYVNGYLRKHGYSPFLVDGQADGLNNVTALSEYPGYYIQGLTFQEMYDRIPADVEILGVSAMFSTDWPLVRDLINGLKARFPAVIIIAGGEHVSAIPEYALRDCAGLDYCVRGEGEHVFYELCERVSAGATVEGVPGIAYLDKKGNFIQSSDVTRIRNIDAIPWPYWPEGYLEKFWVAGKSFGVQTARDMPLMTTRGCPYQCTFCSNKDMWTTRYVLRDVEDVIAEVKYHYEKYNVTSFQIYDLTAITKRSWFIEFLKRLEEINLPVEWSFPAGTRSEILDRGILEALKKVGTSYIVYAAESGSQKTLKDIKKQIDLQAVFKSMKEAKEIGLIIRVNFVIGFPDETRWDIYQTAWAAIKCAIKGVDDVQPWIFNPYPGSALFDEFLQSGKLKLDDQYFLSIANQNNNIFHLHPLSLNKNVPNWELGFYRMVMALTCYGLGYLLYPSRIVRSFKNIRSGKRADTAMEARLRGLLSRKKVGSM